MPNELVEFNSNGGTTEGYLAIPESGTGAGVIVIQEWWGLVPHIKRVADRFAAAGFVALAPDLYHGRTTTSPDEAGKLMMALNIEQTEKDLRGAINYLLAHESVAGDRVGTLGFCMGGTYVMLAAARAPLPAASVAFYGFPVRERTPIAAKLPIDEDEVANIGSPLLLLWGDQDGAVGMENVARYRASLERYGKPAESVIYPGIGHGFLTFDPEAEAFGPSQDAWQRTLAVFRQHLGQQ